VLLVLALAAIACNLGASAPTPTPIPLPSATPFVFYTPTPWASITPITFPTQVPVVVPCNPRNDWLLYTVQAGDALSSIAARSGTTTNALIEANCLANANLIMVGQKLRVPNVPTTVTPAVTKTSTPGTAQQPGGLPTISGVTVEPASRSSSGQYLVGLGTVTVKALGVTNATRVTFYLALTGSSPTILGDDANLLDGASAPWTILSRDIQAQVWAVAANDAGQVKQSAAIAVIYGESIAPVVGPLSITPATTDAARPGVQLVKAGAVLVSVSGVQNATKVSFYFVSSTQGSSPSLLGEDSNLADGAAIIWNVTGGASGLSSGLVWAVASNGAGQTASTASTPVALAP
jgi:murein DD-endopeptidase MepM/ murein hydrolase activator NlpD